jgi:16S rRNA G1207 methylase RsmC
LGCGTGVLGFIAKQVLKNKECLLYGIDKNENAIMASKINS